MKKVISIVLALTLVFTLVGCATNDVSDVADVKGEGVMTYAEYAEAEINSAVTVETYVQAKQSWWDNAATLYTADKDGAYFIYNLPMTEEEYNALAIGTKLKVSGFKAEWAGEIEIIDATYEILEGSYIAPAVDATEKLGTEELVAMQNQFVSFKGMTVEAVNDSGDVFMYNWDGSGAEGTDADLYFNASVNGNTYTFVVEYYVCDANGVYGADTDVYKAVQALNVGDTIDMEGFLYWYEGVQPHITAITVK